MYGDNFAEKFAEIKELNAENFDAAYERARVKREEKKKEQKRKEELEQNKIRWHEEAQQEEEEKQKKREEQARNREEAKKKAEEEAKKKAEEDKKKAEEEAKKKAERAKLRSYKVTPNVTGGTTPGKAVLNKLKGKHLVAKVAEATGVDPDKVNNVLSMSGASTYEEGVAAVNEAKKHNFNTKINRFISSLGDAPDSGVESFGGFQKASSDVYKQGPYKGLPKPEEKTVTEEKVYPAVLSTGPLPEGDNSPAGKFDGSPTARKGTDKEYVDSRKIPTEHDMELANKKAEAERIRDSARYNLNNNTSAKYNKLARNDTKNVKVGLTTDYDVTANEGNEAGRDLDDRLIMWRTAKHPIFGKRKIITYYTDKDGHKIRFALDPKNAGKSGDERFVNAKELPFVSKRGLLKLADKLIASGVPIYDVDDPNELNVDDVPEHLRDMFSDYLSMHDQRKRWEAGVPRAFTIEDGEDFDITGQNIIRRIAFAKELNDTFGELSDTDKKLIFSKGALDRLKKSKPTLAAMLEALRDNGVSDPRDGTVDSPTSRKGDLWNREFDLYYPDIFGPLYDDVIINNNLKGRFSRENKSGELESPERMVFRNRYYQERVNAEGAISNILDILRRDAAKQRLKDLKSEIEEMNERLAPEYEDMTPDTWHLNRGTVTIPVAEGSGIDPDIRVITFGKNTKSKRNAVVRQVTTVDENGMPVRVLEAFVAGQQPNGALSSYDLATDEVTGKKYASLSPNYSNGLIGRKVLKMGEDIHNDDDVKSFLTELRLGGEGVDTGKYFRYKEQKKRLDAAQREQDEEELREATLGKLLFEEHVAIPVLDDETGELTYIPDLIGEGETEEEIKASKNYKLKKFARAMKKINQQASELGFSFTKDDFANINTEARAHKIDDYPNPDKLYSTLLSKKAADEKEADFTRRRDNEAAILARFEKLANAKDKNDDPLYPVIKNGTEEFIVTDEKTGAGIGRYKRFNGTWAPITRFKSQESGYSLGGKHASKTHGVGTLQRIIDLEKTTSSWTKADTLALNRHKVRLSEAQDSEDPGKIAYATAEYAKWVADKYYEYIGGSTVSMLKLQENIKALNSAIKARNVKLMNSLTKNIVKVMDKEGNVGDLNNSNKLPPEALSTIASLLG